MAYSAPKGERKEIYERVLGVLDGLGYLDPEKINPKNLTTKTRFIEDLDADSLDMIELSMAIEEEFGIDFPEEEASQKLKTIGQFVNYVQRRLRAKRKRR